MTNPPQSLTQRQLWLRLILTLFAIAVLVLGGFAFVSRDQPISAEAHAMLMRVQNQPDTSDAFLYLWGLPAPAGADVLETGKAVFARYQVHEAEALNDAESGAFEAYLPESMLVVPNADAPLFCALSDSGCVQAIIADQHLWSKALNQHAELLSRYRQFLTLDGYATLSKPSINETYPRYEYLISGARLAMLDALLLAETGN